jgi:effector-binding domain-containing protein
MRHWRDEGRGVSTTAAVSAASRALRANYRSIHVHRDSTMSLGQYEVREAIVAARPVAGVRTQVRRGRVAQEFARHLNQVYAASRAGAVALDGQNIFIYRQATDEHLVVDFCVGVTAPFAAVGVVLPLETPRGAAAMTTHHGSYGGLYGANAAILAWCRAHDRALAGPSWEVYGHWHADPEQLHTDVYYLLQAAGTESTP